MDTRVRKSCRRQLRVPYVQFNRLSTKTTTGASGSLSNQFVSFMDIFRYLGDVDHLSLFPFMPGAIYPRSVVAIHVTLTTSQQ